MQSEAIIKLMQSIVGIAHTIPYDDDQASIARAAITSASNGMLEPVCVVRPNAVEQIQAIVRSAAANGFGISVMPNAAGNGLTIAPATKASIVCDLSRLDEIYELNTDSGYALLGPGVSFDQLLDHIEARAAPYWIDCDANGANSVAGSVAERALGYTAYGDHLLMQCGMEVITRNGEVMRTGMGALPGSDTWQLFKYNFGPYLDGLFSRSNFGIMTKVGMWLMPAPPAMQAFSVALPDLKAVGEAVEILRPLKIGMVVPNTVVISDQDADGNLRQACNLARGDSETKSWQLFGAIYGIADNVDITWGAVKKGLATVKGASIATTADEAGTSEWSLREGLMRGRPAFRAVAGVGTQRLEFSASAPMEQEAVDEMSKIIDDTLGDTEVEVAREFLLNWRTMFLRIQLNDGGQANSGQARELALAIIDRLSAAGYNISHDCPALSAHVAAQHTSENLHSLYTTIGEVLDPAHVLGP